MKKHIRQQDNSIRASVNDVSDNPKKKFNWSLPKVINPETGKYDDIKNVISKDAYKAYDSVNARYGQINGIGYNLPKAVTSMVDTGFIGYAALAMLLSTNGILNAICKTLSTEMLRKWIEFIVVNNEDNDDINERVNKRIVELEKEFERLDVRATIQKALYHTFAFGGSYIAPAIGKNIDYINPDEETLKELESELIIDDVSIGKGDLQYITAIEPMWVVPIRYDTTNPFNEFFYKPEFFSVMGKTTHYSRLLKFIYNEAPDIFKPTYLFNGVPLIQYCMPYVSDFESIRKAVTFIVQRYNLNVLKTNVEKTITSDDPIIRGQLKQRIQIFNATQANAGTIAIDKDEEFSQINMTLAGLKDLESQAAEFMCIVPKIPATKLLGVSPQGFNSTGEHELTSFYDLCMSLNEEIVRPHLIKIMQMAMLNIWGEIDESISFKFLPMEEMNEKELAEINKINADTYFTLSQSQAIDGEDIREALRNNPNSDFNVLEERERNYINEITKEFESIL